MKALMIHGADDLRYESVPDATIADPRDVVVRMTRCGICGSDLHILHGHVPTSRPTYGIGHEAIGEVVEKGSGVSDLRIGDTVMLSGTVGCGECRSCLTGNGKRCEKRFTTVYGIGAALDGCQAEGIRVPAADFNAARIPEGVSPDQALLLTDNLPTAYGACLGADIRPGRSVAVIGLGAIGLMAVELAMVMGATSVYAIDLVAERRDIARSLGAISLSPENLVEVIREQTGGRMIDCIIEAVGGDRTMALALDLVATQGNVSVLGVNMTMDFRIPFDAFMHGVTIRGDFQTEVSRHWPVLIPMLQSGRIRPDRFITHRGTLADGIAAYDRFDRRIDGVLKTVLTPV